MRPLRNRHTREVVMNRWTRRALGGLLAGLWSALLLPRGRIPRRRRRPPRIPVKPFTEAELWRPHDHAG